MAKNDTAHNKKHFWSSDLRLSWDSTAMPMINQNLQVTKNEIAIKVFGTVNSERAGKVLKGASTDMSDIFNICNTYGIDICQFMLLPDGTHPVMMHRDELARLEGQQVEDEDEENDVDNDEEIRSEAEPADTSEAETENENARDIAGERVRYLNDMNVGEIVRQLSEANAKIAELYERIVELTAEKERLHKGASALFQNGNTPHRIVSDGDY